MAYFDYKVGYREFGQEQAQRIWYASPHHEKDEEDETTESKSLLD